MFIIIMIITVSLWKTLLQSIYHGTLGFSAINLYSLSFSIYSIIHNKHYNRFIDLYNPFFTLLIFGLYSLIRLFVLFVFGIEIIYGFDWFFKDSLLCKPLTNTQHYVSFVFVIISIAPYLVLYILIKNHFKHKGD